MKLNYPKGLMTLIIIFSINFISCKKNDSNTDDNTDGNEVRKVTLVEVQAALVEYIEVSKEYNDANNGSKEHNDLAYVKVEDSKGKSAKGDSVAQLTIKPFDLYTFPKTITVDFGLNGIMCKDQILRKGKIISTLTNWRVNPGATSKTVFQDYYQNSNKIEGEIDTDYIGFDTDSFFVAKSEIKNGKLTRPNGKVICFDRKTTSTQTKGFDTKLNIWDDEFILNIDENCITSDSIKFNISSTEPITFSTLTKIQAGELTIDVEGFDTKIILDYTNKEIRIGVVTLPLN